MTNHTKTFVVFWQGNLHCSWHLFLFLFSLLVLFKFTGGLQKAKFIATIPRLNG